MNKITKNILTIFLLGLGGTAITNAQVTAQKIGLNPTTKDPSAVLEIESTNKGLLIPRVSLSSVLDITTISNSANALTVFNTAAAGTVPNNVTPGYYYWSAAENKWIRIISQNDVQALPLVGDVTGTPDNTKVEKIQGRNVSDVDPIGDQVLTWNEMMAAWEPKAPALADLRIAGVGTNNHLTQDAGIGGDGTNLGFGTKNIAIGPGIMSNIVSGNKNIGIGSDNLNSITDGDENIAIGNSNLFDLSSGGNNIVLGNNSGGYMMDGSNNVIIGNSIAGFFDASNFASLSNSLNISNMIYGHSNKIAVGDYYYHSSTDNVFNETFNVAKGGISIKDINTVDYTGNISTDKIMVADVNGILKTIDPNVLTMEPWQVQTTTNKATNNVENIYQTGSVAIGKDAAQADVTLDVAGAVRGGAAHTGTTGANSIAFGYGNEASGNAAVALGVNVIASGSNSVAIGYGVKAEETNAVAIGNGTTANGWGAFAIGNQTEASGTHSFAMGSETKASGWAASAIGYQTEASGDYSFASGEGTIASEERTIAMGEKTKSSAKNAFSIGEITKAEGVNSVAMGYSSIASGENSLAMGENATASGDTAIAIGFYPTASAGNSIAMGDNSTASGGNSTAMGKLTIASSVFETVLGSYNAITTRSGDEWDENDTDALFQVGNGNDLLRRNALTILKTGKTAIGVNGVEAAAKPTELLDLGGFPTLGDGGIRIRNINSTAYKGNMATDKVVVADANGVLKTVSSLEGVVLKSPGGTCYKVTVSDTGVLTTVAVTCP